MADIDSAPKASKSVWGEDDDDAVPAVDVQTGDDLDTDAYLDSCFASRYVSKPIPKKRIPEQGAPANVVFQLIKDLRSLDATPILNLASFVTTWMEPEAEQLMQLASNVNYVDSSEYPSSTEMQNRCVAMLAHLFHSPAVDACGQGDAVGTACIGSSEAIMLGALALKKRWQAMPRNEGATRAGRLPNLVMGSETHVCWEKFCRYFDVEERYVYAEEGRYVATPELMEPLIDENTIGVVGVLGSTFTGEFEDIEGINNLLVKLNASKGWDLRMHIDAASGGFVAPFVWPELQWDFRLPTVASINVSGHKYGLVYPGLGWAIWRDEQHLPEDLVFYANYLGTVERSVTLNFSKSASTIVAQYYQFLRLGIGGYRKIMLNLRSITRRLEGALLKLGYFEILSKPQGVPLVAFRFKKVLGSDGKEHRRLYDEYNLADVLRRNGWVLPAYTMPPKAEHIKLVRVTIREDLSREMVDRLVDDIAAAVAWLDTHYIFTQEQVEQIGKNLAGRTLGRLDSRVMYDLPSQIKKLQPC